MPQKISPEVRIRIQTLLDLKWSYSMIIKDLKEKQLSISKSTILNIKNKKDLKEINKKMFKKENRRSLTEIQIKGLKVMVEAQEAMADVLETKGSKMEKFDHF